MAQVWTIRGSKWKIHDSACRQEPSFSFVSCSCAKLLWQRQLMGEIVYLSSVWSHHLKKYGQMLLAIFLAMSSLAERREGLTWRHRPSCPSACGRGSHCAHTSTLFGAVACGWHLPDRVSQSVSIDVRLRFCISDVFPSDSTVTPRMSFEN